MTFKRSELKTGQTSNKLTISIRGAPAEPRRERCLGIDLNACLETLFLNQVLNWRLPGFGLILGLFLAALLFSLGPGIVVGPIAFFGLALLVEGIAIFILATPTNQVSSKPRAFSEWTLIDIVWILIALIALTILTIR